MLNVTALPLPARLHVCAASPIAPATAYATSPAQQLAASRLNPKLFSKAGQQWALYPNAALLLQVMSACRDEAQGALQSFYPTDASVAADGNIQSWGGGNA